MVSKPDGPPIRGHWSLLPASRGSETSRMTTPTAPDPIASPVPQQPADVSRPASDGLSRRGFLRGAAVASGGLVAAGLAACTPAGVANWSFGPPATPAAGAASPGASTGASPSASSGAASPSGSAAATAAASSPPAASASASPSASGAAMPAGWTQHDVDARTVIRRYLGNLAPALQGIYGDAVFAKLADILGAADNYPELGEAGVRAGPAARPDRRPAAAEARDGRRRQGLPA